MSRFFLSAWGAQENAGLYTFELEENGFPRQKAFTPFLKAGYLARTKDGRFLYATGGLDEDSDCAAAFAVGEDGCLRFLNKEKSGGLSCCHLCLSPDEKFVYAANYITGNFSEFPVNGDGSLAPAGKTVQHRGSGPHPQRQSSAHAHFCGFTPDGKFLIVIDLGMDALMLYPYTPGEGIGENAVKVSVPPGRGPRHLVFDKAGRIGYVITELGNTVISYAYENGVLTQLCEISTLPCRIDYPTKASAIRLSEDERFLAVTNRGFDAVALVALDGRGGMVLSELVLSGGNSPRDVNFLNGDRFFVAGNEFSDNVYFFDYNRVSGKLTPNGHKLELPRPLCFIE